ncbi:expressed unknown protein [Seminavis robusta]|uniref:Uncharacterized protein n=1 Tax=Seminavis robusta TaxID=568900 RepID=A0A9N8HXN2_9STRA|nr:expressed unknown protein [Seminavis robusta]|eukprot:Sro2256_g321050.1 n/a (701) ;mRNA; f:9991-12093
MANFLKRRDGRPRWSKRGATGSKENRLPTRAMIQLLRRRENPASAAADDSDSNSDMSTFDATRDYYHNNNKSAAADNDDDKLYPILHPTADGTGLEVNFTTTPPPPPVTTATGTIIGASASGAATPARPRSANIVFNKAPHRTLSPLTLESSPTASTLTSGHVQEQEQEEQRQDEVATKDDTAAVVPDTNDNNVPTVVLSTFSATSGLENPSHLPPLPSNISSKDTTIPTTTPMSKACKNVKGKFKQLSNNKKQSTTTTQETVSSLWQEIWQRCVTDCYCITNSNNSTRSSTSTVLLDDDDDNAENSDYFQFLPFAGCMEEEDLADVVPKICETITTGLPKAKSKALMQLARLCDRDHQHNRIPLVCRQESWNVVTVLCQYVLQDPTTTWKDYRQALLILSNLTLPMENKAVLLLGPLREVLLRALYHGLRVGHVVDTDKTTATTMTPLQTQQQLEIHLVCAILFNLSFLQDGREVLLNYNITGSAKGSRSASPLHQKTSLLQTLERMMQHFLPYTTKKKNRQANADSVERQAIRWTFGMMRNLCQDKDMARTIGQTQIPKMALELLQSAATCDKAAYKWKSQSLEDLALGMLIELALRENEQEAQFRAQLGTIKGQPAQKQEHELLVPSLYAISCRDYLEPLLQVSGIHGVRAQAIVKRFDRKEQDVIIVPVDRKEQDSIIAVDHQPHNRKHMSSIASF